MTGLVATISKAGFNTLGNTASASYQRISRATSTTNVAVLGLILVVLQVFDGILTAVGVHHLGVGMEGNIFIRNLMIQIGAIPAIALVKLMGITVVAILCKLSTSITWMSTALKGVIVIYMTAAIIPWTLILISHIA